MKDFPTMTDLRALNDSVVIRKKPHRHREGFATYVTLRWELLIDGKIARGPVHGAYFWTRRDAELEALRLLAPYPGVVDDHLRRAA